jgi:serine/threonine-protein kinase
MGEVYQALDKKLGRSVAIKLLPERFTHDIDWVARFEREARVLASLNDPNVAAIYGVEESEGRKFLVMELVPGESLAERIEGGPIPVEEALGIAKQIAEGMEAAHEKGIIHRDLKPANIKLTPDGKVKVLDFGLAKAFQDQPDSSLSNAPTLTSVSMPGVILGTAAYMSPEQARARPVDRRTDIWAFGCVLYEMLTGKRAFRGESVTDTLAAVIHAEPDRSELPASTPAGVRDLLRRCLQKDVRSRLQAIGDARVAIEEALSGAVRSQTASLPKTQLWKTRLVLSLAGISIAVVAALVTWILKPAPARARDVYKQTITLPPGQRLAGLRTGKPILAISPDEKHIAYVATAQGEDARQIYLYPMESEEVQQVTGSVGGHTPFFSPDGQWLGFYNGQGTLMKIPVRGGVPEPLTDITNALGASWDSGHRIILGSFGSVLQKLSDKGGTPEQLTRLKPGEAMHGFPEVLPGGRAVLFGVSPTSAIAVQEFGANEHQNVHQGPGISMPHYAPSGHLVYAQAGNLVAVPFDLGRLAVEDLVPTTVMSGVLRYSVSPEGSLAYVPGESEFRGYNLVQVSRNGTIQRTFRAAPGSYAQPRVSPDGRRVAIDVLEGAPRIYEIWLYDLGADQPIPFTYKTEGDNRHANWLGSKRLVFQSDREGTRQIFSQSIAGGAAERLTNFSPSPSGGLDIYTFPVSLCRDELLTVIRLVPDAEGWVLHRGDASGQGRKTERLDFPMSADGTPQFSPDCRWLAYVSNESGRREVWVRSFPSLENRLQVSTGGGNEPAWNPDPTKRELFYRNGEDMMAVKISDQGTVEGKAERLFTGSYLAQSSYSRPNYDVFPDGSFLMLKNAVEQEQPLTQIKIVWGWSEQLKRLVPAETK